MAEPTCPTCGHALTAFCPRCRGQAGGAVSSPKKAKAGRKNAQKARRTKAKGDAATRAAHWGQAVRERGTP